LMYWFKVHEKKHVPESIRPDTSYCSSGGWVGWQKALVD
jgi:hypothetical protein